MPRFGLARLDRACSCAGGAVEAVPEPEEEPVAKPGDPWLLGPHRLLCGDATNMDHLEQALGGVLADMAFVDPPYGVSYHGKGRTRGNQKRLTNDDLQAAKFRAFTRP
jgi:DNA modification methylase